VPFLLPLLYQVGLGYSPVQSGLLIMPQAVASMSMKMVMQKLLTRFGYRGVLISNTLFIAFLLILFATIGEATPVWMIVVLAFFYGGFTSLQYTSMNTLVYADIGDNQASKASSVASTMQQMSISFGVAVAGLATAFFVPDSVRTNRQMFIRGIHEAFIALGVFTAVSTVVFRRLKRGDGEKVSQHKVLHTG
jgi:MFS family permease